MRGKMMFLAAAALFLAVSAQAGQYKIGYVCTNFNDTFQTYIVDAAQAAAKAIPGVTAWGTDFSGTHRAPTVSITIDGVHPADAAKKLGEKGILVWDGDFYAVRAIEVLGLAPSGGVIRVGFSMYNTREEISRLLEEIRTLAGA